MPAVISDGWPDAWARALWATDTSSPVIPGDNPHTHPCRTVSEAQGLTTGSTAMPSCHWNPLRNLHVDPLGQLQIDPL